MLCCSVMAGTKHMTNRFGQENWWKLQISGWCERAQESLLGPELLQSKWHPERSWMRPGFDKNVIVILHDLALVSVPQAKGIPKAFVHLELMWKTKPPGHRGLIPDQCTKCRCSVGWITASMFDRSLALGQPRRSAESGMTRSNILLASLK